MLKRNSELADVMELHEVRVGVHEGHVRIDEGDLDRASAGSVLERYAEDFAGRVADEAKHLADDVAARELHARAHEIARVELAFGEIRELVAQNRELRSAKS